jgi:hypothetical protein
MRYVVKYHPNSGEWLVFDMGENFELMSVHATEAEAIASATHFEEAAARRRRYARPAPAPLQEAA